MARTTKDTTKTLISIYNKNFASEDYNQFRITWPGLRSLSGLSKLSEQYLCDINLELSRSGYTLTQLDNFLVVAIEGDFSHIRVVPPRIVEQYLSGNEDVKDDDSLSEKPEQPRWRPTFRMRKKSKAQYAVSII